MQQNDQYLKENNVKMECALCQQVYEDFSKLMAHFRVEHKRRGYATCCNLKFKKRGMLVDHVVWHKNPNAFQCGECQKCFKSSESLELHYKSHSRPRDRIYKCDVCSKSYFREDVLLRHKDLHKERCTPCSMCDKKFPTAYVTNQHIRLVHLSIHVCDVCGKSFKSKDSLQRHFAKHEETVRVFVNCEICGASFTAKRNLERHIKNMHSTENKPVKCHLCSKISPNAEANRKHINFVHNTQRTHQCAMCEKSFKRAPELKEHMATHTGEHLYTCLFCPKTFKSNANMYSHRKKAHPLEWEQLRNRNAQTTNSANLSSTN